MSKPVGGLIGIIYAFIMDITDFILPEGIPDYFEIEEAKKEGKRNDIYRLEAFKRRKKSRSSLRKKTMVFDFKHHYV